MDSAQRETGTVAELAAAVDLARRQADPDAEEFVAQGVRTDLKEHRVNATKLNDRNQQPGILRRLARSRPDLLGKVETGDLKGFSRETTGRMPDRTHLW
ncbi:hypothetical protein THIOKS11020004 [Thiocapsa sp. KS1]|nr:hypothetical protein THIOKS11020004 [Thiocapsa sp. KS1]